MRELNERFEQLERLPAPDLQRHIQTRVQRLEDGSRLGAGGLDPSHHPALRPLLITWLPQVLAVAAIVAFGIGLAVIFHFGRLSTPAKPTPMPGIVAWVDRPGPAFSPPQAVPYPTIAARCLATQLRASAGPSGAGLGNQLEGITLTNVGPTCLLDGRPAVTALNSAGQRVTLSPRPNTYFGPLQPADISQGAHGYIYFGTANACGSGAEQQTSTVYRALALDLPSGSRLDTQLTLTVGSCGLTMDNMGLPAPASPTPAPPEAGSPGTLTVRIDLPATVRAGDTLRYTVVLNNPTPAAVSLLNCPSYTESLGYPNIRDLTFMLNCDQVTAIPSGGKVVYAMEFKIPSDAVAGPTKFNWHLNLPGGSFPGGPGSGGVLTIK